MACSYVRLWVSGIDVKVDLACKLSVKFVFPGVRYLFCSKVLRSNLPRELSVWGRSEVKFIFTCLKLQYMLLKYGPCFLCLFWFPVVCLSIIAPSDYSCYSIALVMCHHDI